MNGYLDQQKKQKYMIAIFSVILVITLVILWFGFLKNKISFSIFKTNLPSNQAGELGSMKDIKINFDFLNTKAFQDLLPFKDVSPFEGKAGRDEPFKPNF